MAENKQDPLIESLMALAVSAAPLIKRARESGMFKAGTREDVAAEAVVDVTPTPPEAVDHAAQKSALQDIIVNQAMKIAALEAEVARLTSKAGKGGGKR